MGERKVLNKYYPPDFDPSKLARMQKPKNQQKSVTHMLPMSVRCSTCGDYIYRGTKFNTRKENVIGETYLGIQILRFYFKCGNCEAEFTVKTDPQNSDYVVESGATRNFESWHKENEKIEAEEMEDRMKTLEYKSLDSKRKMDILAALDETKSRKDRHADVTFDEMLEGLHRREDDHEKRLEEKDKALSKSVVFHNLKDYVRRIHDEDIEIEDQSVHLTDGRVVTRKRQKVSVYLPGKATDALTKACLDEFGKHGHSHGGDRKHDFFVRIIVIKKPVSSDVKSPAVPEQKKESEDYETNTTSGLQSLCKNYGNDEGLVVIIIAVYIFLWLLRIGF